MSGSVDPLPPFATVDRRRHDGDRAEMSLGHGTRRSKKRACGSWLAVRSTQRAARSSYLVDENEKVRT